MRVLCGAATLASYLTVHPDHRDREILDAQEGLHRLTTGRGLDLNQAGRSRAGPLAGCVRLLAEGVHL